MVSVGADQRKPCELQSADFLYQYCPFHATRFLDGALLLSRAVQARSCVALWLFAADEPHAGHRGRLWSADSHWLGQSVSGLVAKSISPALAAKLLHAEQAHAQGCAISA